MTRRLFTQSLLFLFLLLPALCPAQTEERFPKPDFQSGYTRPDLQTPPPRANTREIVDIAVLIAALSLASYLTLKVRSRRYVFVLMLFCMAYFGFYREGCVCSVGSIQNVAYALFNPGYAIPISVILFFALPLLFTLFFGRTFCAAVCPLGAIQDVVVLKPGSLPKTSSGQLQRRKARSGYLSGSLGETGSRQAGARAARVTLAKHVARSVWSRAKATLNPLN